MLLNAGADTDSVIDRRGDEARTKHLLERGVDETNTKHLWAVT